jgi:hypothetical protein
MPRKIEPGDIQFLVIGAAKSGTTWLQAVLKEHPQVFLPERKELHYFNEKFMEAPELPNYNAQKPLDWYLEHFENAKQGQVIGEICPAYLWDEKAPQRIHEFNPDLKLLVILREPIERLFSEYLYFYQRGTLEKKPLAEALKSRPDFLERSLYFKQISRFTALFPAKNFQIYFYDDIQADNQDLLRQVERYIGVDDFIPKNIDVRTNITGVPANRWFNVLLYKARMFLRRQNLTFILDFLRWIGIAYALEQLRSKAKPYDQKPAIEEQTRKELAEFFREDLEKLEKMTGRDLSAWKDSMGL